MRSSAHAPCHRMTARRTTGHRTGGTTVWRIVVRTGRQPVGPIGRLGATVAGRVRPGAMPRAERAHAVRAALSRGRRKSFLHSPE